MAAKNRPFVIALEEHYWDADVAKTFGSGEARDPALRQRLDDLGALRIKEMDEAGIDVQVISHGAPSTQRLDVGERSAFRAARERPATRGGARPPERFAGFAALPTADPKAAADELERAVTKLGFKGANGARTHQRRVLSTTSDSGRYSSAATGRSTCRFYIHPSSPVQAVADAY